jgi:para-aminobenzoate synthetase/4-amino-4-deoxychorismate lyase
MDAAFDLLETLRWTRDGGFFLLDRHLDRMARSAHHRGYACRPESLRRALDQAVDAHAEPLRVRLMLARDGTIRVEAAALAEIVTPARVTFAARPVDRDNELLYHKTTNRIVYDDARREAPADVDDVVLWNADRQVTETTIANIVAEIGGRKLTPPVSCGLLPGTFRAQLLDDGAIEEGILTVDQLAAAPRLWLINSVREWWPAQLLPQTTAAIASTPISASSTAMPATNRSQR